MLSEHETAIEDRIANLVNTLAKLRRLRDEREGHQKSRADDAAPVKVTLALRFPWGGEQITLDLRPLTYITGPLGSGKTRLAQQLAEALPDSAFLGLHRSSDGAAMARAKLDADSILRSRVDEAMSSLVAEGATSSDALLALVVALQEERPMNLVIDLIEQGLDAATQTAVRAQLRQSASKRAHCTLILLTRSLAMLDPPTARPDETIIFCPANHGPPIQVAPHSGAVGYGALMSCLAAPEVRARTDRNDRVAALIGTGHAADQPGKDTACSTSVNTLDCSWNARGL